MKTTIDIPEDALKEAMRFSRSKTKRGAVLAAVTDYNHRQRMARLARHLGTCKGMMTPDELKRMRDKE